MIGRRGRQGGFGAVALLVLVAVLGAAVAVTFSLVRLAAATQRRESMNEEAERYAERALELSISSLSARESRDPFGDPRMGFFSDGGDLDGDGRLARDGENPGDDFGLDGLPNLLEPGFTPSHRDPSRDDANEDRGPDDQPGTTDDGSGTEANGVFDGPDQLLDGPRGEPLPWRNGDVGIDGRGDVDEGSYEPIETADPGADDYHPIFNSGATEMNGLYDAGIAGDGAFPGEGPPRDPADVLHTVELGEAKWKRKSNRIRQIRATRHAMTGVTDDGTYMSADHSLDGFSYVRVFDSQSRIDLNGPDVLTARLVNAVLLTTNLYAPAAAPEIVLGNDVDDDRDGVVDDPAIGRNGRGLEWDAGLEEALVTRSIPRRSDGSIDFAAIDANPSAYPSADADAIRIVRYRDSLPEGRFESLDQILDVTRRDGTPLVGPIDGDEFERFRDFLTLHAWRDPETMRGAAHVLEPRAPVDVNTAPVEVLAAVLLVGLPLPSEPSIRVSVQAPAAQAIALEILRYRMKQNRRRSDGSAAYPVARIGTIRSFQQLEEFFDRFVSALGDAGVVQPFFVPDDVREVIVANRDRLLAQASPNLRTRRFNPDAAAALSLDKSDVEDPTTEFSLWSTGVYELTILMRIVTGQSLVPAGIFPREPYPVRDRDGRPLTVGRVLCAGGRELLRFETRTVIRIATRRREGTQGDFEKAEFEFQAGRRRSMTESFPEHRLGETLFTPFLSSPLPLNDPGGLVGRPTSLTLDRRTGVLYSADASARRVTAISWTNGRPSAAATVVDSLDSGSDVVLDAYFQREGAGRLYASSSSENVRAFDLVAAPSGPRLRSEASIDSAISGRVYPAPEHRGYFAVTGTGHVEFATYPYADPAAFPEIDDLATPGVDERRNGADDDGDGVVDDGPGDPAGRSEGQQNGIDDDADEVSDDGLWPSATHARVGSSALDLGGFVDATVDRTAVQLFVATPSNTIERIGVDGERRPVRLETVARSSALPVRIETDGTGTWLYLLRSDGGLERLAQRGALSVAATIDAALAGDPPRDLAVDAPSGIVFVLGSASLAVVDARGPVLERVETVPIGTGAKRVVVDAARERVFVAHDGGLTAFTYSLGLEAKHLERDGGIKLRADALPLSPPDLLARAGFDEDVFLRARSGTRVPSVLRRVSDRASLAIPTSVYDRDTGLLLPDGVLLAASTTATGTSSGETLFFDTGDLFADAGGSNDAQSLGFREGGMEFWTKLAAIETSRAPASVAIAQAYSSGTIDPEVFVDKRAGLSREEEVRRVVPSLGTPLTFQFDQARVGYVVYTRLELRDFRDGADSDDLVDSAVLVLDRYAIPSEPVTISGSYGPDPPIPFVATPFLAAVESHQHVETPVTIRAGEWMHIAVAWRQIENALSVPEPTVDGRDDDQDGVVDDRPRDPAGKPESSTTDGSDDDGDGVADDGLIRESPLVRLFVNGQWRWRGDSLGSTGFFDSSGVPAGLDAEGASWILLGPSIAGGSPDHEVRATVDDFCLYRRASPLEQPALQPERFGPWEAYHDQNGDGIRSGGEPFQDDDLSGSREPTGTRFDDVNSNGVFDPGEAYEMLGGYDATGRRFRTYGETYLDSNANDVRDPTGDPFADANGSGSRDEDEPYEDVNGNALWDWYGEPFLDSLAGPLHNDRYDLGEGWQDQNGNGTYDFGETYIDLSGNGQYDFGERFQDLDRSRSFDGGEPHASAASDLDHDGRVDGRGSYVGVVPAFLSPGTRVGTLSFTAYVPPGSSLEVEITLRAFSGAVLTRWRGIPGSLGGVSLDLLVREPAYIEYRFDFHVARGVSASPILEDVSISTMGRPEVLEREDRRHPLLRDLERGWMRPLRVP